MNPEDGEYILPSRVCLDAPPKIANRQKYMASCNHMMGVSDLVGLWVIKIKKPMILCARRTPRSSEQSTKRRSSSKNMWKVFHSVVKITRLYDYQTGRHIFVRNSRGALVGFFFSSFFFSCLWFSDSDWLSRQSPMTWKKMKKVYSTFSCGVSQSLGNLCGKQPSSVATGRGYKRMCSFSQACACSPHFRQTDVCPLALNSEPF